MPWRWLRDGSIYHMHTGWESWDWLTCRREGSGQILSMLIPCVGRNEDDGSRPFIVKGQEAQDETWEILFKLKKSLLFIFFLLYSEDGWIPEHRFPREVLGFSLGKSCDTCFSWPHFKWGWTRLSPEVPSIFYYSVILWLQILVSKNSNRVIH